MSQLELFEPPRQDDVDTAGFYLAEGELALPAAREWWEGLPLAELPHDASLAALYAYMSELPIKKEIARFIEKVRKAGNRTAAASDRGDPDVLAVLNAANKAQVEIHRLTGFLRFSPDSRGTYIAKCEPDCFILPALAEHFALRFGETPWAIIDEKRGLCLFRQNDGEVRLEPVSAEAEAGNTDTDSAETAARGQAVDTMENLWRLYHRSVSIESRKNPGLQRQFLPKRYHKHLNEL